MFEGGGGGGGGVGIWPTVQTSSSVNTIKRTKKNDHTDRSFGFLIDSNQTLLS